MHLKPKQYEFSKGNEVKVKPSVDKLDENVTRLKRAVEKLKNPVGPSLEFA